ncbi:Glutathione import ATP-binding protein GsiA [Rhodovastum atsumiense]|uniref:dipeptide ABC transporter ATP-binding protein n=1 Tax=Rhodovastum atsumiense TaxID=504468 RepID=UPI002024E15B|nr:ABC transporter ATP-binding protein [Rhodovastum atsumiense]CAH2598760.1 Glutathione import ATP-binding protein GsiA [Rhodovastum atsumiense]
MATDPVLEIQGLHVTYAGRRPVPAVRGVDLRVRAGEVVAVVGESGSGKSSLAHAVLGLLPPGGRVTGGGIRFAGTDLLRLSERRLGRIRGAGIGLVPQDPGVALNPVQRVGAQIAEVLHLHGQADRRTAWLRAEEILAEVGLDEPALRARQYPHELSGGMRQRVLIGIALACQPRLVIADEPTSALDTTVQRRVLDLLARLTRRAGSAVLLITHDLGVAADRANRLVIMRQGGVVETGDTAALLRAPAHAYTRDLLAAAPAFAPLSPPPPPAEAPPLLEVAHLCKRFPLGRDRAIAAVQDVSFAIPRGSTFALVGGSGSGKTTTARIVTRFEPASGGEIRFDGADITALRGTALRQLRRRLQLVYQNPYTSLDPRFSIADIVAEPLAAFGLATGQDRRRRAAGLLEQVGLGTGLLDRRPGELSGGQRQRVAIARALAPQPDLLVLDEPVSALDVSVQAQILALLRDLQQRLGLTYLLISHDLAMVRQVSHFVGVMRAGHLIETGPTEAVFAAPREEATRELLAAVPGQGWRASVAGG